MRWDKVQNYGKTYHYGSQSGKNCFVAACVCGWKGDGYLFPKGARLALIVHVSKTHSEQTPEEVRRERLGLSI
jgi:hypothetical protein